MQLTCSSLLTINQAMKVIISVNSLPNASPETDLDVDGHCCTEYDNVAEDHEDYELLLKDAPKATQWKTKMSEIKVGCNSSTEENHSQLEYERSYLEHKMLASCEKENMLSIACEDFLDLKFGIESEIMQAFLKPEMPGSKNNCDALMTFLGICYLITYWVSTAKNELKKSQFFQITQCMFN